MRIWEKLETCIHNIVTYIAKTIWYDICLGCLMSLHVFFKFGPQVRLYHFKPLHFLPVYWRLLVKIGSISGLIEGIKVGWHDKRKLQYCSKEKSHWCGKRSPCPIMHNIADPERPYFEQLAIIFRIWLIWGYDQMKTYNIWKTLIVSGKWFGKL